jgi:hypothetical protein
VKKISTLIIGFAVAFVIAPALAEDLTAGKTPAQLFHSDCSACHRSANGLVKERGNVSGLTAFLREHYTTKTESAAALAAYVSALASPGTSARNRGTALPGRDRTRIRSEGDDGPATAATVPEANPADDPPARRRRGSSLTADGDRRRARDDGDVPRPPRGVTTAAPGSHAPAHVSQPQETADPLARLRAYLSSGLDSESASAQAARTGAPKARKRRTTGSDASAATRVNADAPPVPGPPVPAAPAVEATPQPRANAPSEAAPATSQGEQQ